MAHKLKRNGEIWFPPLICTKVATPLCPVLFDFLRDTGLIKRTKDELNNFFQLLQIKAFFIIPEKLTLNLNKNSNQFLKRQIKLLMRS